MCRVAYKLLCAVYATDGAVLSLCLCSFSVWWDLLCKCQQVQVPKSSEVYRLHCILFSVRVMYKFGWGVGGGGGGAQMLHGFGWHGCHIGLMDDSDCRDQDAPASNATLLV